MWGRLSLRWQVAFAVLVPSLAVAVFNGFYFPEQQRDQGLQRLEDQAHVVGGLAAEDISLLLEESEARGMSPPPPILERVKSRVFDRVEQTSRPGAVSFQAMLTPEGEVLAERGNVPSALTLKALRSVKEGGCAERRLDAGPMAFCGLPGGYVYAVGLNAATVVRAEATGPSEVT